MSWKLSENCNCRRGHRQTERREWFYSNGIDNYDHNGIIGVKKRKNYTKNVMVGMHALCWKFNFWQFFKMYSVSFVGTHTPNLLPALCLFILMPRVRMIPSKAPKGQYPIVLVSASCNTSTQYQYQYMMKHCMVLNKSQKLTNCSST